MRVGLGVPMGKSVDSDFFRSFFCLIEENLKKYELINLLNKNLYVDENRNQIVRAAKELACDYLLFLDTDHKFPKGTLDKLMKTMKEKKAKMVSGIYFTKQKRVHTPVIRKYNKVWKTILDYEKGIIEVDGVGMGCCLIDMEIFSKIKRPYFHCYYDAEGGYIGEDISFCKKVRDSGFKIYVDTTLVITHLGSEVNESDFLLVKDKIIKAMRKEGYSL